ncbi:Hsp70 protein [Nocardia amikacinitolerans]|uniref:Hsp70 protein n=1 Tax=Nocardia amikacinitolerans TaxID=756689 RepID=A0A285LU71_9NOCA|nr:Hsp70 family protein [Nocardia amikacinitolerans]SNY87667.1 Hsp70 protein [Nocardia amikacinitolerans]
MTQRLALGIKVGASNSVAVATTGEIGDTQAGPAAGGAVVSHPSVLRLSQGAPPAFGSGAGRTGRHSSDAVLEGFLARVGDPVDILAENGSAHAAEDLVATAVTCLIDEIADVTGEQPGAVVACHPAWWSRHTIDVQRAALDAAGLHEVTLVPEPTAAVQWLEAAHGPLGEGALVVYDLGATGSTVSVVRTGSQTALLASLRSTDVAGSEFDLLTMRYVLANALRGNDFDPFDPVVERELSVLRERCKNAKEELSINTATVVPVRLDPTSPAGDQIRLVRGELEELIRGPLLTSIDLIRDTVHRAGLDIGDISRVLLTGGGGAIPLVGELISSEFGLPLVAAPEPANTSARGAAALAADLLDSAIDTAPVAAFAQDPATPAAPKTKELPALERPGRPGGKESALPVSRIRRLTGRQRAAIVAGAALVIGLLATGTVAIGTGAHSPANSPTAEQSTSTGPADVAAPGGTGAPGTDAPVADPGNGTPQQPKPVASQPGSAPNSIPGSSTVAVVNNQPAPGQPAPGQPAPTAPGEQAAPQPAPQPTPGPNPPAPQPLPQPQQPQAPDLPTEVLTEPLGEVVDGVGGAVGTVLRAPGEILGGNGG